jgi:hypothetical protein
MAFRTGSVAVDIAAVDTRNALGINLGRSRANATEHGMESVGCGAGGSVCDALRHNLADKVFVWFASAANGGDRVRSTRGHQIEIIIQFTTKSTISRAA